MKSEKEIQDRIIELDNDIDYFRISYKETKNKATKICCRKEIDKMRSIKKGLLWVLE